MFLCVASRVHTIYALLLRLDIKGLTDVLTFFGSYQLFYLFLLRFSFLRL